MVPIAFHVNTYCLWIRTVIRIGAQTDLIPGARIMINSALVEVGGLIITDHIIGEPDLTLSEICNINFDINNFAHPSPSP